MVTLTAEWLQLEQALGARPVLQGSAEDIQAQFKDISIEGVKCRIYTPVSQRAPRPVGIYTHGGGFISGDLVSEDPLCRAIADAVDCVIVSLDYRLGPEHKLPAMLQDTLAVYQWAWENVSQLGGDRDAFFSIGGSAGGGLALAIANHYAQRPDTKKYIKGVVAIVPVLCTGKMYLLNSKRTISRTSKTQLMCRLLTSPPWNHSMAVEADPNDSRIFTALSPHHRDFPPTYICTCGADPLRDDGTVMEKALRKSGVPTKLTTYPNLPHYFWIFPDLEASGEFIKDVIAGTNWVIS
ncbi:unnamed protein product [Penicillium egyptiacum]|uniref:Alpha/beta hydrolase fold-3 domain-containing protein n=1 Tax=Penicillium egyptiacum TaxID=1303716 RepID=A0A9W4KAC6_9EURO|nr:unnamed protein product [Penicillium egyptiacum]